jgi:hypothetical protein
MNGPAIFTGEIDHDRRILHSRLSGSEHTSPAHRELRRQSPLTYLPLHSSQAHLSDSR